VRHGAEAGGYAQNLAAQGLEKLLKPDGGRLTWKKL